MTTNNIMMFCGEIQKPFCEYPLLAGAIYGYAE